MGKRLIFLVSLVSGLLLAAPQSYAEAKRSKVKAKISRADCAQLVVQHKPAPDTRYRPGVDVYGRKVAPAGVPGQPSIRSPGAHVLGPETYTIELEMDLRQFLGIPTVPGLNPNLRPGRVAVTGDKIYFNGRPLDDPNQYRVIEACRERLRRTKRN